jgi:hypothetical protein
MWGGPDIRYHKPDGKAFPPPAICAIIRSQRRSDRHHPEVFPLGWQAN